jgi:hypothetical protein
LSKKHEDSYRKISYNANLPLITKKSKGSIDVTIPEDVIVSLKFYLMIPNNLQISSKNSDVYHNSS